MYFGAKLSEYKMRSSTKGFMLFMSVVLILFAFLAMGLGLLGLGVIFLGIGIVLLLSGRAKKGGNETFILYEYGIEHYVKNVKKSALLFSEIEDAYRFSVGRSSIAGFLNSLAYRKNEGDPFHIISVKTVHNMELISQFLNRHAYQHGELLLNRLNAGQQVVFYHVDGKEVWKKRAFALTLSDFIKIDHHKQPLLLTQNEICFRNQRVPILGEDTISTDELTSEIIIRDGNGRIKMKMNYGYLLSSDAFMYVVTNLIEKLKIENIANQA